MGILAFLFEGLVAGWLAGHITSGRGFKALIRSQPDFKVRCSPDWHY
jgi:hypothetical protein